MGVTFGTPVVNNMSSRTSYPLVMSSVTSGQPIFVLHFEWANAYITSITDDFSTPYSWTRVENGTCGASGVDMWIGTGGAGTSGTVTVNAASQTMGGIAVSCIGASTAAGLAALDGHNNATATSGTATSPTLTPNAAGEGAVYAVGSFITSGYPGAPWTDTNILTGGTVQATLSLQASPTSGVGLTATWTGGSTTWRTIAAIVKAQVTGQTLYPDADVDAGTWTTTPLFSKVDEAAAGGDVITDTAS